MISISDENTAVCLLILNTIEQKRRLVTTTGQWRFVKPHRFCHRLDIDLKLEILHRKALAYQRNYFSPDSRSDQLQPENSSTPLNYPNIIRDSHDYRNTNEIWNDDPENVDNLFGFNSNILNGDIHFDDDSFMQQYLSDCDLHSTWDDSPSNCSSVEIDHGYQDFDMAHISESSDDVFPDELHKFTDLSSRFVNGGQNFENDLQMRAFPFSI